ncbi:MAG: GNAT family N-acetyltransferase [Candidatus Heimdallarchaeota archaeon]|nr:GNAT family N-acetyltransferase [Candidatus Heimdallarchaeota archaeon]MBY8995817.1 GNAT family N-acetyltransferase [Candidatus Heimdallarchaeota archaeon]
MIEIKVLDKSSVDKEELLKLTKNQKRNELGRELDVKENEGCEKLTNWLIDSFLTMNFLAYENDELIGWLGAAEVVPPTILLYENHPIIKTNGEKKQIAKKLLQKSFEYATKKKIANIRVFVDVPEAKKKRFLELEQYYLHAGMKQTHTVLCMENKLSTDKLKGIVINSEYHIESPNSQTPESLKNCYDKIFTKSFDNFTNSLDDEERKFWNTIASRNFNDASIVIKKDNEVVALILAVDYGDNMELGPIGVVSNHRGKKLGKVLMEECLSRLIKMEKTNVYLEVDQTNTPAINLYESFGFGEVSKKHGFLYKIIAKN